MIHPLPFQPMFLEKVYIGRNQWYYYVFILLLTFLAWQFIGIIPLVLYAFAHSPGRYADFAPDHQHMLQTALTAAMQTNTGLALTLLSFVFGLAALWAGVRYIQNKPCTAILTGRARTDWKRIGFGAGIWALLSAATFACTLVFTDDPDLVLQFDPLHFFPLLLISLTLLPLQASFEEILFRGYLMQWAGYLFKYRWAAFLLTGIGFGLMHSANPETGMGFWLVMPQYIIMGLILSYITIKDDGLELALGLHIANNVLAAVTVTSSSSALQTHAIFRQLNPEASPWDSVVMAVSGIVFILLCQMKFRFWGKISLRGRIGLPRNRE